MKQSAYNYIVPNGNHTIFYNGITERCFEVPAEKADIYSEILSHPDTYADSFKSFLDKMEKFGFVIADNVDERTLIDAKFHKEWGEDLYHIMVLPTYQCNLRCWYCFQEHQNLWMDEDTVKQIKQLLTNKLADEKIKRVRLSWFGGEPLLGYDIILDVTSFASGLAKKQGKSFTCDITTNATLLNRERIEALHQAGVTNYQITIDGDRETHNSIKSLAGASAYDKAIENVSIITETSPCALRFNYTHENLHPASIINDLKLHLKPENLKNISFRIHKVWQESEALIDKGRLDELLTLSSEMGINPRLQSCGMCYAENDNFTCVFPNGKIEKCDNASPTEAKGKLSEGEVVWNGDLRYQTPAYLNDRFPCRECRYVPICWGPCVARRIKMLSENNRGACMYADKESEMRTMILNSYVNEKLNVRGLS